MSEHGKLLIPECMQLNRMGGPEMAGSVVLIETGGAIREQEGL